MHIGKLVCGRLANQATAAWSEKAEVFRDIILPLIELNLETVRAHVSVKCSSDIPTHGGMSRILKNFRLRRLFTKRDGVWIWDMDNELPYKQFCSGHTR